MDIVVFIACKIIFSLLYRSVELEENNKYAKKGITSAMECANVEAFAA